MLAQKVGTKFAVLPASSAWKSVPAAAALVLLGTSPAGCGGLLGVDFDDARPRTDGKTSFPGADGGGGEYDPVPPSEDGTCSANRKLCDRFCVSKIDPAYGCGETCRPACDSGLLCASGACASNCSGSEVACGQACFDLASSAEHCGSCDTRCAAPTNGTVACVASKCVTACANGFADDGTGNCVANGSSPVEVERLSSNAGFTCGVRADGTLACWGTNQSGQARPPTGTFKQVSAGLSYACAVRTNGGVACWGGDLDGSATPPSGTFVQVSAGTSHTCGVRTDGTVDCWGSNDSGESSPPSGTFTEVAAGLGFSCGIRTNQTITCWGSAGDYALTTAPAGTFKQISADSFHVCALATNGSVSCWGDPDYGETTPPSGTFRSVRVVFRRSCGVQTDNKVKCWGYAVGTIPIDDFRSVSVGTFHACGIRVDDTAVCWGKTDNGQATPPSGAVW